MQNSLKLLIIGDISGDLGLAMMQAYLGKLKERYKADGVIVNGENAANHGKGITPKIVEFLKDLGVNVIYFWKSYLGKERNISIFKKQYRSLATSKFPIKLSGCWSYNF